MQWAWEVYFFACYSFFCASIAQSQVAAAAALVEGATVAVARITATALLSIDPSCHRQSPLRLATRAAARRDTQSATPTLFKIKINHTVRSAENMSIGRRGEWWKAHAARLIELCPLHDPLYVINKQIIREAIQDLSAKLTTINSFFYAIKANENSEIVIDLIFFS